MLQLTTTFAEAHQQQLNLDKKTPNHMATVLEDLVFFNLNGLDFEEFEQL